MATTIQTQITRITTARDSAIQKCGEKGVTISGNETIDDLPTLIDSITFSTVYTGTSEPSSTLGSDGDIYLLLG